MVVNIVDVYRAFCDGRDIKLQVDDTVNPYDNSTLFCPAGMQQFKVKFTSDETGTIANVQSCLRINDLDEIGDGTHFLFFDMLGMFSFRTLTLQQAVDFWLDFMDVLQIQIDYVTIHPDKMQEWSSLYDGRRIEVRPDSDCRWSDGTIGGYCTEFYKDEVEIGNIVCPLGDCIDSGFGLRRLEGVVNDPREMPQEEILIETCDKLIYSGYSPSNKEQGYVLRKLLRKLYELNSTWNHPQFVAEKERQALITLRYRKNKNKKQFRSKSPQWWFDTMGVDVGAEESKLESESESV